MMHSVLYGRPWIQSLGMLRFTVPLDALGLLERRRAVPDRVVRMDVVLDRKPVGPAHFLGAKVGLAKPPAAHRVAEAGVLLPAPGVDIRPLGPQLNARGRAGACAVRR